jgi:hypothetical protein
MKSILLFLGAICVLTVGGIYYFNHPMSQSLECRWINTDGDKSACPLFLTFSGGKKWTMSEFGKKSNLSMNVI